MSFFIRYVRANVARPDCVPGAAPPQRWADPQAQLPGYGPVADLLAALGTDGIARLEGAVLHPPT